MVRVERLGHHHEVRGLLGVTVGERLPRLDEELADLPLDLERLLDLVPELPRLLMTRQVDQNILDLLSGSEKIARVEVVDRLDEQGVDGIGGRRLELRDDVSEIDLIRARADLAFEVGGGNEGRVEPEHELEPDHGFLALALLEIRQHLFEGRHDPLLCLDGKPGVARI